MAGLRIGWLVIVVLLDSSQSKQEQPWELGRMEFAMKYCNNAEFQQLDHPDFKKGPETLENVAARLAGSGVVDLSLELQKYTADLLTIDEDILEKLYKDIICVLAEFNMVGEAVMAGGVVAVCGKDVNYRDAFEATACILSLCDHIQSLVEKMDAFGDTLTPQQSPDVTAASWGIRVALVTLESGLRVLRSAFSASNEGTTQKSPEEYMAESCPGGKDLNSALKDKSANLIKLHFEVVDQAGLPGMLKNLKADLNEYLKEKATDGVSDRLEKSWENLVCTMVPFYALTNHLLEGGHILCFDPEIDYDNGKEVADCLKKRIGQMKSTLPDMIDMKGYPYFDEFLVTAQPIWHSLTDLQIGFAQLLRLANQD